jgi:hypothetical protein
VHVEAAASPDDSERVIREYVKSQLPRLIKRASKALLIEEMEVAENHYRLRATRDRPEVGLVLLDRLDRALGRRSARNNATG